jgi:hypothetical protein
VKEITLAVGASMQRNESPVESTGTGSPVVDRLPAHGYGTVLQVADKQLPDGAFEAVYDYAPILRCDSSQVEGLGYFRALNVEHEPAPQARFRLVQATVSASESGAETTDYCDVGLYLFNLPKGQLDYSVKLRRNSDGIDLTAAHPTAGEWTLHRVPLLNRTPLSLPYKTVYRKPPPKPTPSNPDHVLAQNETRELLSRLGALETLANELVIEARTRLAMKEVDSESQQLIVQQITRLDKELQPTSMVNHPIGVRFVSQMNQMRSLIHDMQVAQPALLNSIMAKEWLAKLPG